MLLYWCSCYWTHGFLNHFDFWWQAGGHRQALAWSSSSRSLGLSHDSNSICGQYRKAGIKNTGNFLAQPFTNTTNRQGCKCLPCSFKVNIWYWKGLVLLSVKGMKCHNLNTWMGFPVLWNSCRNKIAHPDKCFGYHWHSLNQNMIKFDSDRTS